MTTYYLHPTNVQAVAEELGKLAASVQGLIGSLNDECDSTLGQWSGPAQEAFGRYKNAWTEAANDMPVQAANAQNSLTEIHNSYAQAEYQGLGLWGQ